jgi:hypothetical protein
LPQKHRMRRMVSGRYLKTDASIFLCELQYLGGDIFCHRIHGFALNDAEG